MCHPVDGRQLLLKNGESFACGWEFRLFETMLSLSSMRREFPHVPLGDRKVGNLRCKSRYIIVFGGGLFEMPWTKFI